MDNTIVAALIGVAGGLLGVLLGGRLSKQATITGVESSNQNAIKTMKWQEFNKAAVEFQCAFLEAYQQLRDDPKADWSNTLNPKVLLEHEKAAMRFKLFLSSEKRDSFDVDWKTYFTHTLHPGDRRPPEKTPEEWGDKENCAIFRKQIEKLLSYAKLK